MTHDTPDPSSWIARWAALAGPGPVLDLACGSGRHARLFAARGHAVTAVDRDADALARLAGVAGVRTLRADLEDGSPWPLGTRRFAAVIVANYLHRPLFPAIRDALARGGVLLYETFMAGNERYGKPSNADFLLRPGELWQFFGATLEVRAFEQGLRRAPKPAMIQGICAIRGEVR